MKQSARNTDFYGNPVSRDAEGNPYKPMSDGTMDFSAYSQDPSLPTAAGDKSFAAQESGSGIGAGATGAAKTAAAGGSVDDVASSGLIASGNPYAMAAGLGLKAFAANQAAEQAQKQREYEAELATQQRVIASAKEGAAAYDRMRNLV